VSVSVAEEVASPCTQICTLDGELCIGCGRTLDEIGGWSGASSAERLAILARIKAAKARR
jgi:predicted Fe-S protein YdhL (DUF1289 family)